MQEYQVLYEKQIRKFYNVFYNKNFPTKFKRFELIPDQGVNFKE